MKKLYLAILAAVLVCLFCAVGVQAQSPETVYCERCNQDVSADDWQDWNFAEGDVAGGHYRLTDDYFDQTGTIRIPEETIVCLDLGGHTYGIGEIRGFNVNGTFTVMDSVGGGMFFVNGKNSNNWGGFALVQASGTFKLYGGTVRYAATPGTSHYSGSLFYVDGGRVDIHEGTVVGGISQATSSYNAYGGNFTVLNGGRLYIHGGKIAQGVALKSSAKTAQGGNIYAASGSKVFLYGGIVEDGYSDAGGGNIFIAEATLEMTGGIVRNGSSLVSGGNIMANATTANSVTISGGTITGGVAGGTYGTYENGKFARGSKGGGNMYERSPQGSLTITGGTIDGDIVLDYVKTLTLSGAPKIGLGNSGGMLFTDIGSFKANVSGLTEGAEIYVQSSRMFTSNLSSSTAAQTAMTYFKGAVRTALSVTATNALQGTQTTQGYCPHCGDVVTWRNLNTDATFSGHCYLTDNLIRSSNLSVSNSLVLDLNGHTLHQENRRFIFNYNSAKLSLDILDSWGGGRAQGTGTGNAQGGLLYVWPNSTFTLLSGTLNLGGTVQDTTPTDNIVKQGGVIYVASNATINIAGGVIKGGSVTVAEGAGGNIYMAGTGGKLNVSGGIITGGTAASLTGGNIYSAAPVEITGGVITGGKAKDGGNLHTTAACRISGGMIRSGNATEYGGNLYPTGGADITGGLIASGTATTAGGNVGVYGKQVNISADAAIAGGYGKSRGGNFAVGSEATLQITGGLTYGGKSDTRAGNIDQATGGAVTNISGGKIAVGQAPSGGNLYINNGTLNMTGGTVFGGSANNGGNIQLNYNIYATIKDDGDATTPLARISHGKAKSGNGGNILLTAADTSTKYYLHLGNCEIRDGYASGVGQNIYVSDKGVLKILSEFAQNTTAYFHASRNPVKGGLLTTGLNAAEGAFTGQLRLENIDPNPLICAENGNLRVTSAAVVMKDGSSQWFGTNADAVSHYGADAAYMIVDAGELVLKNGDYTVDLAGQQLAISGSGNVTCFDSANDDYSKFGTATISGAVLTNKQQTQQGEKTYITVKDGDAYSFHRIDMGVESLSIRPSAAGVYYSCSWNCDDTLAEKLESFGVAVSLDHMPDANFATDAYVLHTQSGKENFAAGKTGNSVLIANILETGNTKNDTYGRMCIYATPYITVRDESGGQHALVARQDHQASYSLYDVMQMVDRRIEEDPIHYRRLTLPLRNFYETWKDDGMESWQFSKIPTPEEDDVIDVLMIGSSFCYYYVEELYGLAEAAGVKMRVCNAYYSGCKFTWHYEWWKDGKSNYEFYQVTDNTGRKKTSAMSLEHCLAQGQWDVISIQESTSTIYNAGAQNHLDATRAMRNELIGYLKEQFPAAKVYWHQPWSYQIGYKSGSTEVTNFAQQQERMLSIRDFALGVCEENGVGRVNTGEAWQIYRKNYVGTDGLTDTLCARLGVGTNDVGDYYHDGDIGGGQYLNACVWFETLMKDLRPEEEITCIGNTYDPLYGGKHRLSAQLRTALQESAHQAVLDRESGVVSTQ